MVSHLQVAGKPIRRAQINHAQRIVFRQPGWSQRQLAFELCGDWNWRNHQQHLCIKECCRLLLDLEGDGLLHGLPITKRGGSSGWSKVDKWSEAIALDESPITNSLRGMGEVSITPAHSSPGDLLLHRHLLAKYHPIGFKGPVGESMAYLIRDGKGRPLGTILFGSSAWSCRDRDLWLGWSSEARKNNLVLTTNNTRFLILPWVRVPHLASHVLGRVTRHLNADWLQKYGHPVHLVETFVDASRYRGTCYMAAGWQRIGKTCGRGCRASKQVTKSIKDIFVRPLLPNFKETLRHVPS